jgi:HK97 family phage prohead protease
MEAIALGGEARQAQWAAVRARALAALEKAGGGGHDVSDEPRDPSGKWTSGGGDGDKISDEDMRLVGTGVDRSRVEDWRKGLETQLDALEKQGKVGTDEWDKINRTEIALGFFINASEKDKAAGHASLVEVHDGNNKLLAAVFTQHNPKTLVSIIEAIGGLEKAALTKALEHAVLHEEEGNKAERIEKVEYKDQTDTIEAMKAAGFREVPMKIDTSLVRMVKGVEETSAEKPPDLEHLPVPVELSEGTGGSFQADFARAVRDIPPRAAKTMADAGIKVRAGARITQLKPELKGVHPRGWPRGMTWDTAEGLYDRAQKAVHITEFYRPVGSKKFVPSGRIRGVLLHESGHAFDHALGYPSNFSTAYIDAYADDVKQMAKDEKFSLGYYLQKGKAGRSEAFAELFARNVDVGAGAARQDIREFFPNASRLVKQAMDRGSWSEERRALEMSRADAEPSRMNWYFQLVGSIVHLDARLEDGDMLGDAHTEISRGENFYGVDYDALREAKNGVVEVSDDKGKIGLPGGTKPVEKAGGGGHDVEDEPRDEHGRWTDGGGSDDDKGEHPGEGYSKHAYVDKHGVIHTSNVYDAQRALFENRKVELKQPKQISTLIKRLGETAAEMAEQGEAAPVFNLCNVSIEGTNLFCAEQLGIPRVEMPVIPAKQTKKFIKYLKEEGYKVEKDNEYAANLRATQSEIDGAKVATQMARIEKDGFYKRLVISKDDYILDGHHTWAGALGIDAQDNNLHDDKLIKIARVNISITKLLEEAEKWTKEHGIAKKPAGAKQWADVRARALAALREFDESKHPRVPAGSPEGGQFGTGGSGGGASADEPKLDPVVINVGGDEWNRATARKLEREYQSVRPKLETIAAESVGQSAAQAAPATGERGKGKRKKETKAMPIPKPHKGQSQADFMKVCMHEASKNPDRDNEQNVAICLDAWRSKDKGLQAKQIDPPDDDESHEDFLDRCMDQLSDDDPEMSDDDAQEACQVMWEDRSASAKKIVHKTHAAPVEGRAFILSDETPDRLGDIISTEGWDTDAFKKNPVALFNHNSNFPIGRWHDVRVENKALRGELELAAEGISARIDEIRKLVDAGILKAVSVGFRPSKSEPLNAADASFFAPQRYLRQELVECSLVSVPANPNALAVAKSLNVSPATLDVVFAEHGTKDGRSRRRGFTGEHAVHRRTQQKERTGAMSTLGQRIAETQSRVTALRDALDEHLNSLDDSNISDKDLETTNDLTMQLGQVNKQLVSYQEAERQIAGTVNGGGGGGGSRQVAVRTAEPPRPAAAGGNGQADPTPARATVFAAPGSPEPKPLDLMVRAGVVMLRAKVFQRTPEDECRRSYGEHEPTMRTVEWMIRAASAPAMTNVPGWAQELVTQIQGPYMDLLYPKSVYPRLAGMGMSLDFGRNGRIVIPTRAAVPTIAGSFVGEGQPIPVRQGHFTSVTLTPKKLAVISSYTKEMEDFSTPAIEALLRDAIQNDTAISLDSVLLDANPATTVRPPGLLNGVTPLTATAGGGFLAIIGDIKLLTTALLTPTRGNVRNPVWLMNPVQVNSLKLTVAPNTGDFVFAEQMAAGGLNGYPVIDSGTVPPGSVTLLDAADFVAVGAEAPRFELSDQATLHFEDTTPLQIGTPGTPPVVAAPVQSLWQTDSLALRLIMRLNWYVRRPVVANIAAVTW